MPIDRNYATERMNLLLLGGFHLPEEIERIVLEDCFLPEDVTAEDESWVRGEVARAWSGKLDEERGWAGLTDWDRLDIAFAALRATGIIALHQAGTESSDGLTEVAHEYDAAGAENSGVVGYCFYHWQDVEIAIAGYGLRLDFGDISGDPFKGVEIGRRIVAELGRVGLRVAWNGRIEQALHIESLRWQKRAPR